MKIPQTLRDFVSRRDVVKVLATANADGSPNIGPKASTHVFDDVSLAYGEFVGKRHFANVQHDQRIAVATMDWEKREGYRLLVERIEILSPPRPREAILVTKNL